MRQPFSTAELLEDEMIEEMFTVVPDSSGQVRFTPGWTPRGEQPYGRVFDFNGSMEGTTALIEVVPERRYTLALLANRERYVPELLPIASEVRSLVLGAP